MPPEPRVAPGHLHGLADLTLELRQGRTRLTRQYTIPPLLVQRALHPEELAPDLAHIYLCNSTAGIFQGDKLQVVTRLEPGARAHLTTPSATKVYRMPDGVARNDCEITLAADTYLEYLPDPLIPYRGSNLYQSTTVTVDPAATLIYGGILAPGRTAYGEKLAYTHYANRLLIQRPTGYPLYYEAMSLTPEQLSPSRLGILADTATIGVLLIVTEQAPLETLLDEARAALKDYPGARYGLSSLPKGGIGLKALASEVAIVQAIMRKVWEIARLRLLSLGLPPGRKL